jgi:N-acetylglucosamine kinase-like BadF-type ATPase
MKAQFTRKIVAGVDGGKTKTVTVLATIEGVILGTAISGPCNHIYEPGGLERQYHALRASLLGAFERAGLPPQRLRSVTVGLSGSGHTETVRSVYETDALHLSSDLLIAFAGAIPSMHGIIVLAGTGSAAFGMNAQGQEARAGGHGYLVGDEGSGYDIAQRALRAVYQAQDGRTGPTALTQLILDHYGVPTLWALRDRIYGVLTRDELAAAARLVTTAAQADDGVARRILSEAGGELARCAIAVLKQLDWLDSPVPIVPAGSVFRAGSLIIDPMMKQIQTVNPRAMLHPPRFEPVVGAILIALREIGVEPSSGLLANLDQSKSNLVS